MPGKPEATVRKPGWNRQFGGTLVARLESAGKGYATIEVVGPPSRAYVWVGNDEDGCLGTIPLKRLKTLIRKFEREYHD